MFYSNFINLCNQIDKSPSAVAVALGFKKSSVTRWKKGSTPTDRNLQKIADYFNVSVDYLLGKEEHKEKPATTKGSGLDVIFSKFEGLASDLTPDEESKVRDYIALLKAARQGKTPD